MATRFITFLLILLLVLLPLSSGFDQGFKEGMLVTHTLMKNANRINLRRLLSGFDIVLDYDDAGANQRHRKPGGGRNP